MAEVSKDTKYRAELLMRDLEAKERVTAAVLRCMGVTLLQETDWLALNQSERERRFVSELEATLDALDYIVKRIWPAS